jgi:tRNA dimethylallyltransferase
MAPLERAVAVVGPTASGKSTLALAVARRHRRAEIVAVDSMSVYRGMDIGTAKPRPAERAMVPHHLLDLADPSEEFSLCRFQVAAREVLEDLRARCCLPLLVGGTGLYLRAVVDDLNLPGRWPEIAAALEAEADEPGGVPALHARLVALDPVAATRMTPTNRRRVVRALEVTLGSGRPFSSFGPGLTAYPPSKVSMVGVRPSPGTLACRITRRVQDQMAAGWLEEVRELAGRPQGLSRTARQALGYRELLSHLEDGVPLEEAVAATIRRTRAFARRQLAWFRRDPRIQWVGSAEEAEAELESLLAS